MTKIIAVSNHKGGVGKTTSTVNLGAALAIKGYKVCLVDLDPQANLTQSFYDLLINHKSIYHFLGREIKDGSELISPVRVRKNIFIIPSSMDLAAAESELNSELGREYFLKDLLLSPVCIDEKFDYILIDCPPSLGFLTINALAVAHDVLIPLHAEYLPFNGLINLKEMINKIKVRINPQLRISGVFLTKFSSRTVLNRDTQENVHELFGDKLLKTTISTNIALAEAPSRHQDIFSYDSKCKGALEYMALCEELLEKEGLDGKEKL